MKNIIVFLLLFATACSNKSSEAPEAAHVHEAENVITLNEAQRKNAAIEIDSLQSKNLSKTLRLNGKTDVPPQNLVAISVPLGGYLKSTKLLPGMQVKKGELIATMEDQQYIQLQQAYLTTKAQLVQASSEFNRQKELNQEKASSDQVYQQAASQFTTLKINLKSLSEQLKLINITPEKLNENNISSSIPIYAPFTGFITKVHAPVGKYIAPADVAFELVDPSDIHLNLTVFEKDLIQIEEGMNVLAYTNSEPEEIHPAHIILISRDIDQNRTAEVHCHFDNYEPKLLPGMYMNATVELKKHNALTITEEAVVSFEGKDYVFVEQKSNSFEMVPVELGVLEFGSIELLNASHLQQKKIVIKGAYTLLMTLKNTEDEEH